MSLAPEWMEAVAAMTADLELGPPLRVERLCGGRNNRVYRVDTATRPLLLKHYYRGTDDPRDRLASDFGFTRFAWEHGLRCIAEPLAAAPLFGMALYEHVDGQTLAPGDVDDARIDQALDLVATLNQHRRSAAASILPFAAEACFSVEDHLETVAARVRRLQRASDNVAAAATIERLTVLWQRVRERAERRLAATLPAAAVRCLSPSDLGFHNALLLGDGRLVFHDFEYAGWDDPAKLVCDFVSQVEVPVPRTALEHVVTRVSAALELPAAYRSRIDLLLTVYRVKWVCIVLNDLLPEAARRRHFAAPVVEDGVVRLRRQLQTAAAMLQPIEDELSGLR